MTETVHVASFERIMQLARLLEREPLEAAAISAPRSVGGYTIVGITQDGGFAALKGGQTIVLRAEHPDISAPQRRLLRRVTELVDETAADRDRFLVAVLRACERNRAKRDKRQVKALLDEVLLRGVPGLYNLTLADVPTVVAARIRRQAESRQQHSAAQQQAGITSKKKKKLGNQIGKLTKRYAKAWWNDPTQQNWD